MSGLHTDQRRKGNFAVKLQMHADARASDPWQQAILAILFACILTSLVYTTNLNYIYLCTTLRNQIGNETSCRCEWIMSTTKF